MSPEDEEFLRDMDNQLQWFCDKIYEPKPVHPDDVANVFSRMISVGWVRRSEYELYKQLTTPDDD